MALYVGLMSGTSLDGVDGVLVDFDAGARQGTLVLRAHGYKAFDTSLRAQLLALNTRGDDELHRAALASNAIARHYAAVVTDLLVRGQVHREEVHALGAHGQTVRHRPGEFDRTGYTLQLLNGSLLAEMTGIDVVADLRSRDVAAGGQGAPLVPAFHAAMFSQPGESRAVLNLGGIANLTILGADGNALGFDCGPGCMLLDAWCARHLGVSFDDRGDWASKGRIVERLLSSLLDLPWLQAVPPKSTGRDQFNMSWLDSKCADHAAGAQPIDVQATLSAYTVECVRRHLERYAPGTTNLYVCGGGARNVHLVARLALALPQMNVATTDDLGIAAEQVEATAFAWLAHQFMTGQPGSLASVTGAAGPRRLGALYPAR
jgi:anhydro-N-acetylmuramic acid kinase